MCVACAPILGHNLLGVSMIRKRNRPKIYPIVIDVFLRSPQREFLEAMAAQEASTDPEQTDRLLSTCFRGIIDRAIERDQRISQAAPAPTKKTRLHVYLSEHHLQYIDGLVTKLGLQRADVTRRLIDWERTHQAPLASVKRTVRRF